MTKPRYSRVAGELNINLIDSSFSIELVEAVIDVDDFGEVIGVEILGLLARHPGVANQVQKLEGLAGEVILTFDPDADALYLRFRNGRSLDQLVKRAAVLLGPDGDLVKVVVDMG